MKLTKEQIKQAINNLTEKQREALRQMTSVDQQRFFVAVAAEGKVKIDFEKILSKIKLKKTGS